MEQNLLLASFSWKHGFLANQSKGLYDQQALPKEKAKSLSKKQCPTAKNTCTPPQWNFPMSKAALPCTNSTKTTNPSLASLYTLNQQLQ